ncbi:MAG TPA: hypothetical protein VMH30_12400 [Verrucomicrobiae bacterium]|nr:hypothetical protein [Verrucomicrobiae bacterium]
MKPRRIFILLICAALGVTLLGCGLLVPAHWSAVDAGVLQAAGRNTTDLVARGQQMARENKLGNAFLLAEAAESENLPGGAKLEGSITNLVVQNAAAFFWGDDSATPGIFGDGVNPSESLTAFLIPRENREAALAQLQSSPGAAVTELLRTRSLNNTVLLPASASASGQTFDAAVAICGLLLEENRLSGSLGGEISEFASQANNVGNSLPLERTLMDFLSLGQRFNWDQLTAFVAGVPDADTLDQLADQARNADQQMPVLFAAVVLSGHPAEVSDYVAKFPDTGLSDLGASLQYGAGGVSQLAASGKRYYRSDLERRLTAYNPFGAVYLIGARATARNLPLALAAKWLLYFLAGFCLALALHFAMPPVERALQVRGFHIAREILFSVGFLLAVLLLSEPFLAQAGQKGEHFSLRLLPSLSGGVVPAGIAGITQTIMNPTILITLLVFFVLQALVYTSCLVKLAEIRRQNIPPRMKLKLLENEDHLFDAGLYLGFVGTIVSLIVASLGLVKFSLMAAYSSTSFGIIFVVIFKIFHLRPLRRKLLMASEVQTMNEEKRAVPPAPRLAPTPTPAVP